MRQNAKLRTGSDMYRDQRDMHRLNGQVEDLYSNQPVADNFKFKSRLPSAYTNRNVKDFLKTQYGDHVPHSGHQMASNVHGKFGYSHSHSTTTASSASSVKRSESQYSSTNNSLQRHQASAFSEVKSSRNINYNQPQNSMFIQGNDALDASCAMDVLSEQGNSNMKSSRYQQHIDQTLTYPSEAPKSKLPISSNQGKLILPEATSKIQTSQRSSIKSSSGLEQTESNTADIRGKSRVKFIEKRTVPILNTESYSNALESSKVSTQRESSSERSSVSGAGSMIHVRLSGANLGHDKGSAEGKIMQIVQLSGTGSSQPAFVANVHHEKGPMTEKSTGEHDKKNKPKKKGKYALVSKENICNLRSGCKGHNHSKHVLESQSERLSSNRFGFSHYAHVGSQDSKHFDASSYREQQRAQSAKDSQERSYEYHQHLSSESSSKSHRRAKSSSDNYTRTKHEKQLQHTKSDRDFEQSKPPDKYHDHSLSTGDVKSEDSRYSRSRHSSHVQQSVLEGEKHVVGETLSTNAHQYSTDGTSVRKEQQELRTLTWPLRTPKECEVSDDDGQNAPFRRSRRRRTSASTGHRTTGIPTKVSIGQNKEATQSRKRTRDEIRIDTIGTETSIQGSYIADERRLNQTEEVDQREKATLVHAEACKSTSDHFWEHNESTTKRIRTTDSQVGATERRVTDNVGTHIERSRKTGKNEEMVNVVQMQRLDHDTIELSVATVCSNPGPSHSNHKSDESSERLARTIEVLHSDVKIHVKESQIPTIAHKRSADNARISNQQSRSESRDSTMHVVVSKSKAQPAKLYIQGPRYEPAPKVNTDEHTCSRGLTKQSDHVKAASQEAKDYVKHVTSNTMQSVSQSSSKHASQDLMSSKNHYSNFFENEYRSLSSCSDKAIATSRSVIKDKEDYSNTYRNTDHTYVEETSKKLQNRHERLARLQQDSEELRNSLSEIQNSLTSYTKKHEEVDMKLHRQFLERRHEKHGNRDQTQNTEKQVARRNDDYDKLDARVDSQHSSVVATSKTLQTTTRNVERRTTRDEQTGLSRIHNQSTSETKQVSPDNDHFHNNNFTSSEADRSKLAEYSTIKHAIEETNSTKDLRWSGKSSISLENTYSEYYSNHTRDHISEQTNLRNAEKNLSNNNQDSKHVVSSRDVHTKGERSSTNSRIPTVRSTGIASDGYLQRTSEDVVRSYHSESTRSHDSTKTEVESGSFSTVDQRVMHRESDITSIHDKNHERRSGAPVNHELDQRNRTEPNHRLDVSTVGTHKYGTEKLSTHQQNREELLTSTDISRKGIESISKSVTEHAVETRKSVIASTHTKVTEENRHSIMTKNESHEYSKGAAISSNKAISSHSESTTSISKTREQELEERLNAWMDRLSIYSGNDSTKSEERALEDKSLFKQADSISNKTSTSSVLDDHAAIKDVASRSDVNDIHSLQYTDSVRNKHSGSSSISNSYTTISSSVGKSRDVSTYRHETLSVHEQETSHTSLQTTSSTISDYSKSSTFHRQSTSEARSIEHSVDTQNASKNVRNAIERTATYDDRSPESHSSSPSMYVTHAENLDTRVTEANMDTFSDQAGASFKGFDSNLSKFDSRENQEDRDTYTKITTDKYSATSVRDFDNSKVLSGTSISAGKEEFFDSPRGSLTHWNVASEEREREVERRLGGSGSAAALNATSASEEVVWHDYASSSTRSTTRTSGRNSVGSTSRSVISTSTSSQRQPSYIAGDGGFGNQEISPYGPDIGIMPSPDPIVCPPQNVPQVQPPMVGAQSFTIRTYTGRHHCAGTDANVFIKLYGVRESGDIELKDCENHRNPFESGQVDDFKGYAQTGVLGSVYKIRIWHDNSGDWPGWLLNEVHIIPDDDNYGKPTVFKVNKWIFKDGDQEPSFEMELDDFPFAGLDLMKDQNSKEHHTEKFKEVPDNTLIVRRGQSFDLKVYCKRPIRDTDEFKITLSTGKKPRASDKTLAEIDMVKMSDFEGGDDKWVFAQYPQRTRELRNYQIYKVNIPGDALPARYKITVETDEEILSEDEYNITILFNPWSPADDVYMPDTALLREYVVRQKGCIYVGSGKSPGRKDWYFGQFEKCTLDAVFDVLESFKAKNRDSPIEVARLMSARVNANDDRGVLVGNWSGDYSGGKKPTYWVSTTAILEQYLDESKSVCFGQCWVFSAIVTAMMRCLGIPCRSVTNFNSAHDTQGNVSIDVYLDEDGDELKSNMNRDSVWNFHVWNDVWMARPDLPVGFGGWQAIDATPQERSQGLMQMGPSSLRAIKEGRIELGYDTPFVVAEVNADKIYWQMDKANKWEAIYTNREVIGMRISTKSPYSFSREDITDQYKFAEGSVLERASIKKAMKYAGNVAVRAMRDDISMKVDARSDEINVGEDLILHVNLMNNSSKDLVVSLTVGGQVVRYDGVPIVQLEKHKERITVKANGGNIHQTGFDGQQYGQQLRTTFEGGVVHRVEISTRDRTNPRAVVSPRARGNEIPIKIPASHYTPYLEDDTMIRFVAAAKVISTGQVLMRDALVNLKKPGLRFEYMPPEFKLGAENEFTVTFINPLDEDLTECELYIDGSLNNSRTYLKARNVPAGGKFSQNVKVYANTGVGKKSLMVSFSCKQMGGLYGTTCIRCSVDPVPYSLSSTN